MDIKEYKCADCERLNNYSDDMRCASCGFLHNKNGKEQLFSVGFTYNDQTISDLDKINEKHLKMILGLSTVSDEIWKDVLEKGKYINASIEYFWEKVDDSVEA